MSIVAAKDSSSSVKEKPFRRQELLDNIHLWNIAKQRKNRYVSTNEEIPVTVEGKRYTIQLGSPKELLQMPFGIETEPYSSSTDNKTVSVGNVGTTSVKFNLSGEHDAATETHYAVQFVQALRNRVCKQIEHGVNGEGGDKYVPALKKPTKQSYEDYFDSRFNVPITEPKANSTYSRQMTLKVPCKAMELNGKVVQLPTCDVYDVKKSLKEPVTDPHRLLELTRAGSGAYFVVSVKPVSCIKSDLYLRLGVLKAYIVEGAFRNTGGDAEYDDEDLLALAQFAEQTTTQVSGEKRKNDEDDDSDSKRARTDNSEDDNAGAQE